MARPEPVRKALRNRPDPKNDVYYLWNGGKKIKVYDMVTGETKTFPEEIPTIYKSNPSDDEIEHFFDSLIQGKYKKYIENL